MATSGSVDFSQTRDDLISFALKKIGVLGEGDTPTANQVTDAAQELNMMVKHWQIDGLQLWAMKRATIFTEKNKSSYTLGPSGDHATSSYVETTLNADAGASATNLTVTSITGISASDNIGIVLDDGSIHFDTVNGAPSGTTVVITNGLASAATTGVAIYAYTTKIDRPLRIINVYRRDSSGNDVPLEIISRDEYYNLNNKTTDGAIVQAYYDPQLDNGTLYVWPETDNVTTSIELVYHRPFEDFDVATDNPDFPQEWYLALGYNLAMLLGDTYSIPDKYLNRITRKALAFKYEAESFSVEDTSVYFMPEDQRG